MDQVLKIVLGAVREIGDENDNEALKNADQDTLLFGSGNLDSMGVVLLVSELEDIIDDEMGISLTLADEKAMSQRTSPFRSVKTLTKYIENVLNEEK